MQICTHTHLYKKLYLNILNCIPGIHGFIFLYYKKRQILLTVSDHHLKKSETSTILDMCQYFWSRYKIIQETLCRRSSIRPIYTYRPVHDSVSCKDILDMYVIHTIINHGLQYNKRFSYKY